MSRETLTTRTFVELVDTLVEDFDVIDLLTVLVDRSVELLDVAAGGILLADERGRLRVMAASSEQARLLELFQLQNDEGPCLDCVATGTLVVDADLARTTRWPRFSAEAVASGFAGVCAVPLRLRDVVLGGCNFFLAEPARLSGDDVALAQALAHVASIAIVQDQVLRESRVRKGQLQHALDSRVAIEQAKGMIAEHRGVDMEAAFALLRRYARNTNGRLTDVAGGVVNGSLPIDSLAPRS